MNESNHEKDQQDVFPIFSLLSTSDKVIDNSIFKNKKIVLFIYPKSNTPTCTKESLFFSENIEKFEKLNFHIFGLSNDNTLVQKKFKTKHNLKFDIISDEKLIIIKKIGAWVEKKMYGKVYNGTERTTLIINDNKIIKIWRKVKIKNHIQEVLDYIRK